MGLFNGESKDEKKERKKVEMMQRLGVEGMSDEKDVEAVAEMSGNSLIEFGTALSGKGEDVAKISYLRAILEQNFIIIRQLDKISQGLNK